MYLRRTLAAITLVTLILLAGFLVGCGGQSDEESQGNTSGAQSENGSQVGTSADGQGQESGETNEGGDRVRIALGTVLTASAEDRRLVVRPTAPDQGDRLIFRVGDRARIMLNEREANFEDAERGQRVQVRYVVRNDRNRARQVMLFSEGQASEGGQTAN